MMFGAKEFALLLSAEGTTILHSNRWFHFSVFLNFQLNFNNFVFYDWAQSELVGSIPMEWFHWSDNCPYVRNLVFGCLWKDSSVYFSFRANVNRIFFANARKHSHPTYTRLQLHWFHDSQIRSVFKRTSMPSMPNQLLFRLPRPLALRFVTVLLVALVLLLLSDAKYPILFRINIRAAVQCNSKKQQHCCCSIITTNGMTKTGERIQRNECIWAFGYAQKVYWLLLLYYNVCACILHEIIGIVSCCCCCCYLIWSMRCNNVYKFSIF